MQLFYCCEIANFARNQLYEESGCNNGVNNNFIIDSLKQISENMKIALKGEEIKALIRNQYHFSLYISSSSSINYM